MESLIKVHGIKAFSASLVSPTIREGVQNMLLVGCDFHRMSMSPVGACMSPVGYAED